MKRKINDRRIISQLRRNARESTAIIARNIDIPVTKVFSRLEQLEEDGIIRKYVSLIDFSKIGYWLRIVYLIKSDRARINEMAELLAHSPHINTLQRIRGGFDFYAEMIFANLKQVEEFQHELEERGALKVEGYHILCQLKSEGFTIE
ncbi:MAG: Lrp/AsnC family transcriptional regulator [Candidatus Woesearchaeota archaeon]